MFILFLTMLKKKKNQKKTYNPETSSGHQPAVNIEVRQGNEQLQLYVWQDKGYNVFNTFTAVSPLSAEQKNFYQLTIAKAAKSAIEKQW